MKKKLVLMRHGETVFNQRKRIQGWVDSPLTALGIAQAKHSGAWIQKLPFDFDHAYCSTAERASDTLELIWDREYRRIKGLKEMNFGRLDGEPEYLNPPLEEYSTFFKAQGGESREEVTERMKRTLLKIMNQEDHHNVLAVSHGGAIRNFEKHYCPDDSKWINGRLYNCAVLVFDFDTDTQQFTLVDAYNPNYKG